MHPILGLIQILAIGFVIGLGSLILYTAWMLTHPPRRTYAWSVSRSQAGDPSELDEPLQFENCEIDTKHGRVPIWDIAGRDPTGPVVLMTHGWGSSRQGALKRMYPIADHASRIIAWDLPGHGEAPAHAQMGADEHEAAIELLTVLGISDEDLVLFGWSMGAGISLAIAADPHCPQRLRGVICEAVYRVPYTPAQAVLALRGIPHRLSLKPALSLIGLKLGQGARWHGFDRAQLAARVQVPTLFLHGDQDPVSPIQDAMDVSEYAPHAERCIIDGAGHNNIWADPHYRAVASEAVSGFMKRSCGC
ncbi:MAG: alpha/beta hydrolase [Phycisphaerales bacterium]|nr:alpha/beta hydrolase [Phycisphaerales bacterium]